MSKKSKRIGLPAYVHKGKNRKGHQVVEVSTPVTDGLRISRLLLIGPPRTKKAQPVVKLGKHRSFKPQHS